MLMVNVITKNVKKQRGSHKIQAGFTLTELMIVILIVGILGAIVIPRLTSTSAMNARLAADVAAADIRGVQAAAMSGGTPYTISFTAGNRAYAAGGLIPTNRSLPPGATANNNFLVKFNTLGEPELDANLTLVINSGLESASLTVEMLTGKVTITNP